MATNEGPLRVAPGVTVPPAAIEFRAIRAGGPGGQNVNKVASKVELRVVIDGIVGLDGGARARLRRLAAGKLDADGRLVVTSQRTRDQARNRADAEEKVVELVARALVPPTPRRPTRPTRGSVERRLDAKQHQSRTKARRRGSDE